MTYQNDSQKALLFSDYDQQDYSECFLGINTIDFQQAL